MTGAVIFGLTLPVLWLIFAGSRGTFSPGVRAAAASLYLGFGGTVSSRATGVSLTFVGLALLAVCLVIGALRTRRVIALPGVPEALQFTLTTLLLAHLILVPHPPVVAAKALAVLAVLLVVLAAPPLTQVDQVLLIKAIVAGGAAVAAACFVQVSVSPTLFNLVDVPPSYEIGAIRRATGLTGNANAAAFFLSVGLAGALALLTEVRRHVISMRLLVLMHVLAILLTQSRAGLVAVALLAALHLRRMSQRGGGAPAVLLVTAAGGLLALAVYGPALVRLVLPDRAPADLLSDSSRSARFDQAWEVILRNPLLGDPSSEFEGQRANYHNDLVQMAADHGLPAALILLALLLVCYTRLRSAARTAADAAALTRVGLDVLLVGLTFSLTHLILTTGTLLWLIIALALRVAARAGAADGVRRVPDGTFAAARSAIR